MSTVKSSSWIIYVWVTTLMLLEDGTGEVNAARWSHSVYLHPDYRLLWAFGPRDITFEVQAKTLGYVGFGLSRDGRVAGADMVIGWVDKGQVYFQDRHVKESSDGNLDIEVDSSQDYQLLLGYENNTHTVLRFRRRLNTCDGHDTPIANDTLRVIYLMNHEDPKAINALPAYAASIIGNQSMYFMQRVNHETPSDENKQNVWEVRNSQVELPPVGDYLHWCRIVRPPKLSSKHHIIRYAPLLQDREAKHIQRMILYECYENNEIINLVDKPGLPCYERGVPAMACSTIVAKWSHGSEGFNFPPETGYPLEPTTNYYMLETHYYNPRISNANKADSSGLRLYYTSELRRHDAGVLSVGINPNWRHIIPPGQPRVVSSGHCIADCTRKGFPKLGIQIFAVVSQTHMIGRKFRFRQIRGNTELPPITADSNLDFGYQEYRSLDAPVKVFPGDHLIAECTYNSSDRATITLGGTTSREETCLATALYYPRQKTLTTCHSLPTLPTVLHSLGIEGLQPESNPLRISSPPELSGMTLESRLLTYDWSRQFDTFEEVTRKGSFKPFCLSANYSPLSDIKNVAQFPDIIEVYPWPTDQCWPKQRPFEVELADPPPTFFDINHIEGPARSKVSRSPSTQEHSLQYNRGSFYSTKLYFVVVGAVLVIRIF